MKNTTQIHMKAIRNIGEAIEEIRDKWSNEEAENENLKWQTSRSIEALVKEQAQATNEVDYREASERLKSAGDKLNYYDQQTALFKISHKLTSDEYAQYMADFNDHKHAITEDQRTEIMRLYEEISTKIDEYVTMMKEAEEINNAIRTAAGKPKQEARRSLMLELIPEQFARDWQKDRFSCFVVGYKHSRLKYRGS